MKFGKYFANVSYLKSFGEMLINDKVLHEALPRTSGKVKKIQSSSRILTVICGSCWLSGIFIFTISELVHTDPTSEERIHAIVSVLSLSGMMMFMTGVYGYWGALHLQHHLIHSFTCVLLACSTVQLCCGAVILSLSASPAQDDALMLVNATVKGWTKFFRLQKQYNCCGANSYEDWIDSLWWKEEREANSLLVVPDSCCIEKDCNKGTPPFRNLSDVDKVHQKGCEDILLSQRQFHFWLLSVSTFLEGLYLLAAYFSIHCLVNVILKMEYDLPVG